MCKKEIKQVREEITHQSQIGNCDSKFTGGRTQRKAITSVVSSRDTTHEMIQTQRTVARKQESFHEIHVMKSQESQHNQLRGVR